ncbi:hypothetical protein QBC40DRAFT_294886 [Triangularia verruculosa]|uniref:Chromo domain-containing protein n=1 Tax=Triangularia verruculosa TaxID=2587418 RepID=A0AAN7AXS9_9PEZI|nr:hypothetical protein QBC40DRAFT_294886 [Triangularia verruculosa]
MARKEGENPESGSRLRSNNSFVNRDDQDDFPPQSTGGREEIEDNDLPSITNKGVKYKIRWRSYTEKDDTWEPECNISEDRVDEYNKGQDSSSDDDAPLVRSRDSRRPNAAVDSSSDDDAPLVRPRGSRRSKATVDSSSDREDANDEDNDEHGHDDLLHQDNHAGHSCSHEDGSDAEFFHEEEGEDESEDDDYNDEPESDFGEDVVVEDGQLVNLNEYPDEDDTPYQTQPSAKKAKKTKQPLQLSKDEPPAHLFEGAPDENAKRFQEWLKLFVYCLWTGIDVKAKEKGE